MSPATSPASWRGRPVPAPAARNVMPSMEKVCGASRVWIRTAPAGITVEGGSTSSEAGPMISVLLGFDGSDSLVAPDADVVQLQVRRTVALRQGEDEVVLARRKVVVAESVAPGPVLGEDVPSRGGLCRSCPYRRPRGCRSRGRGCSHCRRGNRPRPPFAKAGCPAARPCDRPRQPRGRRRRPAVADLTVPTALFWMSAARTWLFLIFFVVTALLRMSDVLTLLVLMSPESTLLRPCRAIALPPAIAKNSARQAMTVWGWGS